MFRYREILPGHRLRSLVLTFWILEDDGADSEPQRVVPDGRAELILNWEQPFEALQADHWQGQPRYFLAGQIEKPLLLRSHGPAKILGIRFHPHGTARVLKPPMHELCGHFTPIDALSRSLSRGLNDALESPDPVTAVEAALLSAAEDSCGRDLIVEEAVRRICSANGLLNLSDLAHELNLSTRQLERRFRSAAGLPPKMFCRIQRFNTVFRVLGEKSPNWVDTAVDCGYYDQAHLIRDCKELAGITPPVLFAEDGDLARHFYQRCKMSHSSKIDEHVFA